ncbi:MAG: type 1 glutamine amidotransferase [Propionivibrio sp.]
MAARVESPAARQPLPEFTFTRRSTMKPVAIVRHTKSEGPAYFATFLDSRSLPWQLIAIDAGDCVPADAGAFAGLCLMGGPMSVNDPLPWIDEVGALIRDADARGLPVIGHCLGGQLISKAFGGEVTRSPVKEIGWGHARAETNESAGHWLGDSLVASGGEATVFQWHGETFSLPDGAQRILRNECCANQMFVLGHHLAMQCHVEMTPELIVRWCQGWPDEVRGLDPLPDNIQTPALMQAQMHDKIPVMRRLADQLYSVWIEGLGGVSTE